MTPYGAKHTHPAARCLCCSTRATRAKARRSEKRARRWGREEIAQQEAAGDATAGGPESSAPGPALQASTYSGSTR